MLLNRNAERSTRRHTPHRAQTRHYDPARHIACLAAGVNYARRTVSAAIDPGQAQRDLYSQALPETWDVEELSAVLPPQLKADSRPIFPGQTKANGNPLPPPPY